MKYASFILFLILSIVSQAQVVEGEIIYETKVDLHRNIPDEMSGMKDRIPPYRTNNQILIFNQEASIFKQYKSASTAEQAPPPGRRRGRRFMNNNVDNTLYRDLQSNTAINSTEFFGKKFLVTGAPQEYSWKLTGETKQVGDYLCQKAVFQDSIENILVWFTPMIPVSAGPNQYGGLPGMILYVNINDGERVITATEINQKEIEAASIEKPTEGKEISREEFEKIRKEKMEEMRKEYGGQGRRFIMRGGE
jgi:GLPGLI family protein